MNIGKIEYYEIGFMELTKVATQESYLTTITSRDAHALVATYLLVMVPMVFVGWLVGRNVRLIPTPLQLGLELIVGFVDELCRDSLGKSLGRAFTPFIATIFIFVALCNYAGIFFFTEPTAVVNTPLALGLLGFAIALYQAFKYKGVWGYMKELVMEPIPIIMFPLNIIGELSKIVSISFRLFGNIMGGAIIIAVVGGLVKQILLPVGLNAFFGGFVGTIQAFVFMMLTLTYIAMNVTVEEEKVA
ncbi:MAG: F0F1 ATP synthase subunit A [Candidatus Cloacimonetes bacterium]|nr:F0F1 ATP synthase subunit A [Candidatus Cloacimonadota bacterium]